VARIRSIKPDFFTSETIARLSKATRLTFIGIWTHVDDNGVCVLNEMLITAALYPLDDPMESIADIREDLRRLSGEGLVTLYRVAGKRYLFVNSWDEHQKISHPGKPRYPRPTVEGCEFLTSEFTNPPEDYRRPSGGLPEALRPEQGAGSREQGEEKLSSASPDSTDDGTDFALIAEASVAPEHPHMAPKRAWTADQIYQDPHFAEFWKAFPLKVDKPEAATAWLKHIRNGIDPAAITKGAIRYRDDPERSRERKFIKHPPGWLNNQKWEDDQMATPPPTNGKWWDN